MSSARKKNVLSRVMEALTSSPWARSAGRVAAFLLGLVLLALVGSGRLGRWLTPPPRMGIAVAEAAPPPTSGTVSAQEAASAPPPEVAAATMDGGAPPVEAGDGGAPSPGVAQDGKVILNLATEDDLRKLPGIGRGRAQAILALRARLKKFTRIEDLLKVKGIGRRGLARLRPLVRVD
jgi:competence protein ComEA